MMPSTDDILFNNKLSTEPIKGLDELFNVNVDKDLETIPIKICYVQLKSDKTIGNEIIKAFVDSLIVIGISDESENINVCYFNGNYFTYFWVKSDEIEGEKLIVEQWSFEDSKRHFKAIEEKWTIEKKEKLKKSLIVDKNIEKELKPKSYKVSS
ncbi:MAG TPA: hypothetical protein VNX68_14030, partial [Nitrosopumilaceae archaeon]|nr:hypothetical protein [Nitrosopumilaceae archaeon]